MRGYYTPKGGLPPQTQKMTGQAVLTPAYAFIPRGCFSDIVTSFLPGWDKTRAWIIARPMSGFAETFSQRGGEPARFHWIRKRYEACARGSPRPRPLW
jgi:(S)-ureidoglycine aminohydrolase